MLSSPRRTFVSAALVVGLLSGASCADPGSTSPGSGGSTTSTTSNAGGSGGGTNAAGGGGSTTGTSGGTTSNDGACSVGSDCNSGNCRYGRCVWIRTIERRGSSGYKGDVALTRTNDAYVAALPYGEGSALKVFGVPTSIPTEGGATWVRFDADAKILAGPTHFPAAFPDGAGGIFYLAGNSQGDSLLLVEDTVRRIRPNGDVAWTVKFKPKVPKTYRVCDPWAIWLFDEGDAAILLEQFEGQPCVFEGAGSPWEMPSPISQWGLVHISAAGAADRHVSLGNPWEVTMTGGGRNLYLVGETAAKPTDVAGVTVAPESLFAVSLDATSLAANGSAVLKLSSTSNLAAGRPRATASALYIHGSIGPGQSLGTHKAPAGDPSFVGHFDLKQSKLGLATFAVVPDTTQLFSITRPDFDSKGRLVTIGRLGKGSKSTYPVDMFGKLLPTVPAPGSVIAALDSASLKAEVTELLDADPDTMVISPDGTGLLFVNRVRGGYPSDTTIFGKPYSMAEDGQMTVLVSYGRVFPD